MGRTGRRRLVAGLLAVGVLTAGCTGSTGSAGHRSGPTTAAAAPAVSVPTRSPTPTTPAVSSSARRTTSPPASQTHTSAHRTSSSAPTPKPTAGPLPLDYSTGDATQVITVRADSTSSTEGTLQAWRRSGHGWRKVGDSVHAYLGADGVSTHPSESRSATPIGSFTLTQAFGRDSDPGTALPYTHTTPSDWWISQPGKLYNTRQRCSSHCDFSRGDPNEHLYYETPYYRYAVVIDYNTPNAPGGVRQGAGSAFFLHVTVHEPTAGCVSIDEDDLVRILRWLVPSAHPRIMIGIG